MNLNRPRRFNFSRLAVEPFYAEEDRRIGAIDARRSISPRCGPSGTEDEDYIWAARFFKTPGCWKATQQPEVRIVATTLYDQPLIIPRIVISVSNEAERHAVLRLLNYRGLNAADVAVRVDNRSPHAD